MSEISPLAPCLQHLARDLIRPRSRVTQGQVRYQTKPVRSWPAPRGASGSGAAPGADTADTGTVVVDACPRTFQETWSRLGRARIGNGLREGTVAETLYLTPGLDGPAHLTKKMMDARLGVEL